MTEKEIQLLALKFLKGEASKEEEALLHAWYDNKGADDEQIVITTDDETTEEVKKRLYQHIKSQMTGRKLSIRTMARYAAAVVLVLSCLGSLFYLKKPSPDKVHYTKLLKNDVGPGSNNAVLRLGEEAEVNLDEGPIGNLAEANGLVVNKNEDGSLLLVASHINGKDAKQRINTLQTPKGGQYKIELPDGTKVWLNASSILKFPSIFDQASREIELEGEAYFEVAHLSDKNAKNIPFIVNGKDQKVEVLGTHFNINSYADESIVKTTLLEGSVRIVANNSQQQLLLKPGQQSLVQNGIIHTKTADIESDIAWKNGDFIFNNESLESVMRKLERWYDVEVEYQGEFTGLRFSGAVSRSKNISEVLKIMKLTGKVKFTIEGRRIIVMT